MRRSKKEICVFCEEIVKGFEYDKKTPKLIPSKKYTSFFPSKALLTEFILKLVNEVAALITE